MQPSALGGRSVPRRAIPRFPAREPGVSLVWRLCVHWVHIGALIGARVRSAQAIQNSSVCEDMPALMDPTVVTQVDLLAKRAEKCPLFLPCSSGSLLGPTLHNCVPRMAHDVARFVSRGSTLDVEMGDLGRAAVFSTKGFIDPYVNPDRDSKTFTTRKKNEILAKVRERAEQILNGVTTAARDERCICPVLRPTPGGCPVHGG